MNLVYLSPVTWQSFAQRPHQFVRWLHERSGAKVLWIEPYPTRLPTLSDMRRLGGRADAVPQAAPAWLQVLRVRSLPLEPLPGLAGVNYGLWRDSVRAVRQFAATGPAILGIGKPSTLALQLLGIGAWAGSFYDAMDDFPAFYSGLSAWSVRRKEMAVATRVSQMMVTSTALERRWAPVLASVQLVRNGLDLSHLSAAPERPPRSKQTVWGYVGTVSSWFDWDWVLALARLRAHDEIRLIGPIYTPAPRALPANVRLLPAVAHADALKAMQQFDVGLIPFKINTLTESVDPIKYYEYRATGLPVLSTAFGDMRQRACEPGTFLSAADDGLAAAALAALQCPHDKAAAAQFAAANSWQARFDPISDWLLRPPCA